MEKKSRKRPSILIQSERNREENRGKRKYEKGLKECCVIME